MNGKVIKMRKQHLRKENVKSMDGVNKKMLYLSDSNYAKKALEERFNSIETPFIKLFENYKDKLLTVKELAVFLGVSIKTVRDWVLKRKIPVVRVHRLVRFNPIIIAIWLAERSMY